MNCILKYCIHVYQCASVTSALLGFNQRAHALIRQNLQQ